MPQKDKLIIFDTTLRDGEQSPGASMTLPEKLQIARMLEKLGVDVIEAGFAIASAGDFAAIKTIATNIKNSTICSLARTLKDDIDAAANSVKKAARPRIHTFIATSPIHMQYKLKMTEEQVITTAVNAVKRARNYVSDVEFSCEDAGRSKPDFLCQIIEQAINAGATTINIPDTVGYTMPHEYATIFSNLLNRIPNADKAIFSTHTHNDLGLGVANSLAAVIAGARQVECTINGLGERAGNSSLEELVMIVKTKNKDLAVSCEHIDSKQLLSISRTVAQITGFPVQPNKAIVGANAFAHEAGIHQDGILKHRETYEIMRAADVGWGDNKLVLGKHSGRSALKARLVELGYVIEKLDDFDDYFQRFKNLVDNKHEVFDEDLHALMSNYQASAGKYKLISLSVQCGTAQNAQINISLEIDGKIKQTTSTGNGPVDAIFRAIKKLANSHAKLKLYSVNAITKNSDAQGEVTVRLEHKGKIVNGNGTDTDILTASAKAYIDALNIMEKEPPKKHPQLLGNV